MVRLTVSDVKQYSYCPRIPYFTYIQPVDKKVTPKMEFGKEEHLDFSRLEKRRTLAAYRLDEGERSFQVRLSSERLGLEGVLDLLVINTQGYFPVEFKNSTRAPELNHKYQLVAYAMLVEDVHRVRVRHGFIYLIPNKRVYPVRVTQSARDFVKSVLARIRSMVQAETMPAGARSWARCTDCEFRNFCADRW